MTTLYIARLQRKAPGANIWTQVQRPSVFRNRDACLEDSRHLLSYVRDQSAGEDVQYRIELRTVLLQETEYIG